MKRRVDSMGAQESWSMREERQLFISSQLAVLFKCLHGFEERVFSFDATLGCVTVILRLDFGQITLFIA